MNSKVELIYENNEYKVIVNNSVINKETDIEKAYEQFKNVINNNKSAESRAWNDIVEKFSGIESKDLEINNQYRTMTYGNMKYFYNMGKVFYMANGQMIPLIGGYSLFKFTLYEVCNGNLEKANKFIEFCKDIVLKDINYRISDSSIIISSASFNYGSAEYNFSSGKINKGASITTGSFEDFKAYVLDIINKR